MEDRVNRAVTRARSGVRFRYEPHEMGDLTVTGK